MFNNKKKPSTIEEKEKEWVPDHKHKQCMFCHKQFSMLNRRHHCRSCGSLVCSNCSKNKWYIESSNNDNKYERVCDVCFDKLSNDRPFVTNSNPHLRVLSEPNFFSWLSTFNKSWIRSRYPEQYAKYKRKLLGTSSSSKPKKSKLKPSNANIVSKLTPHAIDKKIEENKQRKKQRKYSSDQSESTPENNATKKIYQRLQKQKYQASMQEEKEKQAHPNYNYPATLQKTKSIAKKKKYNPLIVVQTGLLYVNIREAQGLPDCDRFSQPDGYCIYYVTNNDPCFGEAFKYSTKVQHNTYEPKWNEDETIIITNTTGTLVIELWDYDFGPEDDYLGKVEIKLADLFLHFSCQQPRHSIIDDWFEVNLAPEWRNQKNKQMAKIARKRKTKTMFNANNSTVYTNPHSAQLLKLKYNRTSRILQIPNDNDEYDTDNLQLTAVYKRLTMPLLCIDNVYNDEVIKGKCYIHLQLKLKASWWGHFISHFDPLLPPPPKKVAFDMTIFYAQLNKMLLYVYPVMDGSQSAMDILFWVKYVWATVYLLMYMYCVFHPWFVVFWLQYRLLTYVCHSYCAQTVLSKDNSIDGSKKFNLPLWLHWLVVLFGVIPCIFDSVSNTNKQLRNKEKAGKNNEDSSDDESDNELSLQQQPTKKSSVSEEKQSDDAQEQDITMGAFTTMMGNKVVRVSGLKDNLGWYQELLVWMNELIDYSVKLLNWTYVSITSMIVIALMISCLLNIILKNTSFYQYELLFIGFSSMAYFSKPIQFIQWLVLGISSWYYNYYSKYTKFKTEINSSEKYDSDFEESDEECLDGDDVVSDNPETGKDIGSMAQYLHKLLKIMYVVCELCMDLIVGLLEFIKGIVAADAERKNAKKPMLNRSKTFPTARKRTLQTTQSSESIVGEACPVYLSAEALSGSSRRGRSVKSSYEVDRILKQRKYSTAADSKSKSKISRFGTILGFGVDADDGYIQQNKRQNKKKKKKELKKVKKTKNTRTMQRQPTLLRKKTLKEIESAADAGINSMLQKLHQNLHDLHDLY